MNFWRHCKESTNRISIFRRTFIKLFGYTFIRCLALPASTDERVLLIYYENKFLSGELNTYGLVYMWYSLWCITCVPNVNPFIFFGILTSLFYNCYFSLFSCYYWKLNYPYLYVQLDCLKWVLRYKLVCTSVIVLFLLCYMVCTSVIVFFLLCYILSNCCNF